MPAGIPRGLFAPIINEIDMVRFLTSHNKSNNCPYLINQIDTNSKQGSIVSIQEKCGTKNFMHAKNLSMIFRVEDKFRLRESSAKEMFR